jgi:hypothetical protein
MPCSLIDCPFYDETRKGCGLSVGAGSSVYGPISGDSLVYASIEIGRALAEKNFISFRAKGSSMYPCLKQGDTLFVMPCEIDAANVGDIAVIRRNGMLIAHRIFSKGEEGHLPCIVTSSDRHHGNDGPTCQSDFLGIVSRAERNQRPLNLDLQEPGALDKLSVSLWEGWNWHVKPWVVRLLDNLQQQLFYRALATAYFRIRYPKPVVTVQLPLKPMPQTDLYRVFSVSGFNLANVQQRGQAVVEWAMQLEFQKKVPAARVTFVCRPEGCPDGSGWHVGQSWSRIRYRGAGLEARLIDEATKILGRSGFSLSNHQ